MKKKTKATKTATLTVGRYNVTCEYEPRPRWDDSPGTELRSAAAVLSFASPINGDEAKFAREALGLQRSDLARLLDVDAEAISRWETGAEPIHRQTQLALLQLVERAARPETATGGAFKMVLVVLVDPPEPAVDQIEKYVHCQGCLRNHLRYPLDVGFTATGVKVSCRGHGLVWHLTPEKLREELAKSPLARGVES